MTVTLKRKKARHHILITSILLVMAGCIFFVLWKGLSLNPTVIKSSQLGRTASEFEVDVLEGSSWLPQVRDGRISLQDLRGRKVVLNFWASWCVSCRQEAKELETFWQRSRERNIIVLGIAIQDTPESAVEFAKAHGKTYPIAIDTSGKTSIDYGVSGVPETFLIDESGVILHKETGPVTAELLETLNLKYQANLFGPK
jgi:cytochrome c biogenesis protein CcmG, thiol:disulfide interchange protein DsbE